MLQQAGAQQMGVAGGVVLRKQAEVRRREVAEAQSQQARLRLAVRVEMQLHHHQPRQQAQQGEQKPCRAVSETYDVEHRVACGESAVEVAEDNFFLHVYGLFHVDDAEESEEPQHDVGLQEAVVVEQVGGVAALSVNACQLHVAQYAEDDEYGGEI